MQHRGEAMRTLMELLMDWPSDGRPDRYADCDDALAQALTLGYVERITHKEQCKMCSAERDGYSFYRVTRHGRLLADAAALIRSLMRDIGISEHTIPTKKREIVATELLAQIEGK